MSSIKFEMMSIGRTLVLSYWCWVFVSRLQSVAIRKAVFWMVCRFLMLVFDMIVFHMVFAHFKIGRVIASNSKVSNSINYGPRAPFCPPPIFVRPAKAQENNFTLFSLLVVVIYEKIITFIGAPTQKSFMRQWSFARILWHLPKSWFSSTLRIGQKNCLRFSDEDHISS